MSNFRLVNVQKAFSILDYTPIIVNDLTVITEDDKKRLDDLLFTEYDTDTLRPAPQCNCGKTKGMFKLHEECPECLTTVQEPFSRKVESQVWIRPLGNRGKFMNPAAWIMIDRALTMNGVNCLRYMTDPYYKPTKKLPDRLRFTMERYENKRSFKFFTDNFNEIMETFIVHTGRRKIPQKLDTLNQFLEKNNKDLFTDVLPVPNKVLFPIEKSGDNGYGNKSMLHVINAVRLVQETEASIDRLTDRQLDARMFKIMDLFAKFHAIYLKDDLGGKFGTLRQHVYGGRWNFTSRAVCISLFEPHDFREVHFPWAVAFEQYQMQIVNKLIKRGYSLKALYKKLKECALNYDDEIYTIFNELIEESPYMGLPIILQRNPTLKRGSAQLLYVTHIKPNVNDNTLNISLGVIAPMNCDFDGDQLNSVACTDRYMHDKFSPLNPIKNVMDANEPWGVSGDLKMHPPVIATTANWLTRGRLRVENA